MTIFILRRLGVSCIALFGISIVLFALLHSIPGDPAAMFFSPTDFNGDRTAAIAAVRIQLGLDKPLPIQYLAWLGQIFTGNLGTSFQTGEPVGQLILSRLGATGYLMISGTLIALLIGITAGIVAAIRKNAATDYLVSLFSLIVVSVPAFFVALLGIYVFGLKLGILPTAGINDPGGGWLDAFRHLAMPAVILGLGGAAGYVRWARSSMLDVLDQDYMVTARSKGLSRPRIVIRHGLHNALIPLVTVVAMSIPALFGGSVVIEEIFAWPGTGKMAVDAITNRDYPVIMGFVMMTAILVLLCNLLADVAYAAIDPRIRL